MMSIERIRVPIALIILLSYCLFLFAPLYPVGVHRSEWRYPCLPPDSCLDESDYLEVQPPLLVLASGFEWTASTATTDSGMNYTYAADPLLAAAFLVCPVIIALLLVLVTSRASSKTAGAKWRFVVLRRRSWRTCLWLTGLGFLLLSAFWAWNYLLFYGSLGSSAFVDPLLISIVGTFLMSGLGFAAMMLAVRSRAIWPDRAEEAGE